MRIGRPLSPLTVSAEQLEQLQSWSRRAKTAQALALRSRIVLLAATVWPTRRSPAGRAVLAADGGQVAAAIHRLRG
jgi:hypothetical protein